MFIDPSLILDECYQQCADVSVLALPVGTGARVDQEWRTARRVEQPRDHRDKSPSLGSVAHLALVARLVGQDEIASTPFAAKDMDQEWDRLRNNIMWDENSPRDWADVRNEAKKGGFDVHFGHLCGTCVDKK